MSLEALGGIQPLFGRKGCGSVSSASLNRCQSLHDLLYLYKASAYHWGLAFELARARARTRARARGQG